MLSSAGWWCWLQYRAYISGGAVLESLLLVGVWQGWIALWLRKTYFSVLLYTVLGDVRCSQWVSAKGVVLGECLTETHSPLK